MKKIALLFLFTVHAICSLGQGQLFYACTHNQQLLKININTCDTFFIGLTPWHIFDIAITPDNRLYGITNSTLVEINTNTAALTIITSSLGCSSNALVSDNAGNLLTVDSDSLYQINRFTGQVSCLGYYGRYASAGDLTFYNDTLYLSAKDNKLVKIILQPPISSQLIGTMQATNIYGINTICNNNNTETMIASGGDFGVSSLYIVNPVNASLTLLCDSIVHALIYGAASQKESTPQVCFVAGLNSPVSANELNLFPNPATTEVTINFSNQAHRLNGGLYNVQLSNTLGEVLEQTQTNAATLTLNMSSYTRGIYFITVTDEAGNKMVSPPATQKPTRWWAGKVVKM